VSCRGLSNMGTGKHELGRVGVPVCIGDVMINPADFVVGDRDGVIIAPKTEWMK